MDFEGEAKSLFDQVVEQRGELAVKWIEHALLRAYMRGTASDESIRSATAIIKSQEGKPEGLVAAASDFLIGVYRMKRICIKSADADLIGA